MVELITQELTNEFKKTELEARIILEKVDIMGLLKKHPLSLHDSPHNWAVGVLTKVKDRETLPVFRIHNL